MPTYGETPSTFHTPQHAIHTSNNDRVCPHTAEIHTYDIRMPICTMAKRQCVSCIRIEVGSIYPTKQEELRAVAAKQVDTCVAGVA